MSFPWAARKLFYRQAASQISNGRALTEVLEDFRERAIRRKRKKIAERVHQIYRLVRDGKTLVMAMDGDLTDLERSILDSGERAGKIPQAMELILDLRDRMTRIRHKVQASLFAPSIYLLSLYAVLVTIGIYVIPQFAETAPVSKWTGWAKVMYYMGAVATSWYTPIILVVMVAFAAWIIWLLPRWSGESRVFCDKHVFPFTAYRELTGFSWVLSFIALLRAGVPDVDALENQIKMASPWLVSRLRPIQSGLRDGLNMADALRRSGYEFPSLDLIDEIGAYVAFPDFAEKIEKVSREYADTLERKLMWTSAVTGSVFSGLMFLSFIVIQLGSNAVGSVISTNMGIH